MTRHTWKKKNRWSLLFVFPDLLLPLLLWLLLFYMATHIIYLFRHFIPLVGPKNYAKWHACFSTLPYSCLVRKFSQCWSFGAVAKLWPTGTTSEARCIRSDKFCSTRGELDRTRKMCRLSPTLFILGLHV